MSKVNLNTGILEVNPLVSVLGEVTGFEENIQVDAYASASGEKYNMTILEFCSRLDDMNNSGTGLLVKPLIRARRQKQNLFASVLSEHYRQIFEPVCLNEAIEIFDSQAEANSSAQQTASLLDHLWNAQ